MHFVLLNQTVDVSRDGWDNANIPKLLRYNLHYFDDLNAKNSPDRIEWHNQLISFWIAENAPPKGTGWEPYPTSLRIVNWIKWALSDNTLSDEALASLACQARWLARRLEWHITGNHLFSNAKALVFSGLFFEGPEAQKWLTLGISILSEQVKEQILPDGGQYELSTMYHALALEDMLDLINVANCYKQALSPKQAEEFEKWRTKIRQMTVWLNSTSHPDGKISFFNDATFGVALENQVLKDYAVALGIFGSHTECEETQQQNDGYVRLERGSAVVIADVAPIGPDHLPGHAHADSLSFELSVFGQRTVVNSGISEYGVGEKRQQQRATAAHSTLILNKQDSSEIWGGFRVGRRARIYDCAFHKKNGTLVLQASHDGYRHLPGSPSHRRTWFLNDHGLTVRDEVFGSASFFGEVRFHLSPNIVVRSKSRNVLSLFMGNKKVLSVSLSSKDSLNVQIKEGAWHPEFGKTSKNIVLSAGFIGSKKVEVVTRFFW